MNSPVLAIDPGEQRIGVAISDPTHTLARPLTVVQHRSRDQDVRALADLAANEQVGLILIGQSLDSAGEATLSGRRARRLAGALRRVTVLPVELIDEFGTTKAAQAALRELGLSKKDRRGHQDVLAATRLLQDFLDSKAARNDPGESR